MTVHDAEPANAADSVEVSEEVELPENLPPKAWVTLLLFAGFVVVTGTCMSGLFF